MVETGNASLTDIDDFAVSETVLGKGSFSVVKSAVHVPSQTALAAKIIDLTKHKDVFIQETSALSRLNHQHIVKCFHTQITQDGKGVIFLERIGYPSLQSYLAQHRNLQMHLAMHLFAQMVDAVDHMHKNGVAHSDLKPENIAYDTDTKTVKVFDFGLSQLVYPGSLSSNFVGSPLYMAPEVLLREKYSAFSSDVWSLAIVLIEMLTGRTPFSSFVCMDELLDFVSFETSVPLPDVIPADVRELLRKMLDFNPATRISVSGVKDLLRQFL